LCGGFKHVQKQVQELLMDQQHQLTLLLRGQSSLRGSMNNLRRSTIEKDAKTKQLHQQLEQQHGAALRWVVVAGRVAAVKAWEQAAKTSSTQRRGKGYRLYQHASCA
jgi:hypothetical protein